MSGQPPTRIHNQLRMLQQLCVVKAIVVGGQHQAVVAGNAFGRQRHGLQVKVVVPLAREGGYVRVAVVDVRALGLQQVHDFDGG